LCQRYPSSQKGGTLIIDGVDDLVEHERRLDSGAYRPDGCPRCNQPVHVHDRRPRLLAGDVAASTEIARFRCSDRQGCGAVWQVLPRLLARHLWRAWRTVEAAVVEPVKASVVQAVPARTRRRWRARLASSAALVADVLSAAFDVGFAARVAKAADVTASRGQFARAVAAELRPPVGQRLSHLAALVHRLAPGVRLM
jgi:hypothetical protein